MTTLLVTARAPREMLSVTTVTRWATLPGIAQMEQQISLATTAMKLDITQGTAQSMKTKTDYMNL